MQEVLAQTKSAIMDEALRTSPGRSKPVCRAGGVRVLMRPHCWLRDGLRGATSLEGLEHLHSGYYALGFPPDEALDCGEAL